MYLEMKRSWGGGVLVFKGRTLISKGEDFNLGIREAVDINDKREIILQEQKLQGSYFSPEFNTNGFKDLVSSWNAHTPKGAEIELFIQVKVGEEWSRWFSYGKWATHDIRGSVKDQSDELARMDIDTLVILNGKEATAFKYKVTLSRSDLSIKSPMVKAIFATLRLTEGKELLLDESIKWLVDLDVPERSQMVVPKIGNIICSPTSMSMVMEYYGDKIDTEEVADNVLDNGADIYGNWSYNVAYAGSRGFTAYVARFFSANEIKDKIAQGIPLVASIRTKTVDELKGTQMAYPSGHLIVVRGFTIGDDGEEYVIVNDPADPENIAVRREYKLSEFEKAWGKIVYVLTPDPK